MTRINIARWNYLGSCRGLELEADPPRSDGLLQRWGKTGVGKGRNKRKSNIHSVQCWTQASTFFMFHPKSSSNCCPSNTNLARILNEGADYYFNLIFAFKNDSQSFTGSPVTDRHISSLGSIKFKLKRTDGGLL